MENLSTGNAAIDAKVEEWMRWDKTTWDPMQRTDQQSTIVYAYKDGPFKTAEDLLDIVSNPDLSRVSTQPPFRPKAGEIYVYPSDQRMYNDKRTWTYDGYRWRNNGKHKYPKPNPVFEKVYFNIESPNIEEVDFRRCAYIPINKNLKYLVVQYFGNEAAAGSVVYAPWEQKSNLCPPGARSETVDYDISMVDGHIRLSPILEDKRGIYNVPDFTNIADMVHQPSEIATTAQQSTSKFRKRKPVPAAMPSSMATTSSALAIGRNSTSEGDVWSEENGVRIFQFRRKTYTNLMDIGFNMMSNNYFWSFISVPEIIVVFGNCELCGDLDDLLSSGSDQVNFLSYSTSPCLDGFFTSVLSLHHSKFAMADSSSSSAVIPLVFMIHQNTSSLEHAVLLGILQKQLTHLKDRTKYSNLAFVIDRDPNVRDALEKCFPNSFVLLSLSCVKREAQCWLMKNLQTKRSDQYMADLEGLMKSGSKTEFDSHFQSHKKNCSRSWLNFLEVNLMDDLERHCSSWSKVKNKVIHFDILEEHQNASLSQVLNDLELWHDATMDKLVQSLYLLQQFLTRELTKGRCGLGTYRLLQRFCSEARTPQSFDLSQVCRPPSLIVKMVMTMTSDDILNKMDDTKAVASHPDDDAACHTDQGADKLMKTIKREPESDDCDEESEDGNEASKMASSDDITANRPSSLSGQGRKRKRIPADSDDQDDD